mmetsp:Transcript_277/g.336  ORF Transcript_277/g.336 Transcript_277/m.336 type:complete len:184 (+) Transcript_277:42-593(+)
MFRFFLSLLVLVAFLSSSDAASKKAKVEDPKFCEVCVSNLEKIDALIPADKKRDRDAIEKAVFTRCTLSGFGSDWKPNPLLETPRDIKMCYLFEPIKKAISQPFSTGMPKLKVCKRLMKDNPEICEVKYPLKVEKKEGEKVDYNSMRVKQLKTLLDQRGVRCSGCTEKTEFVKRCEETENLDL